ncbi:MAG: toxin-antitoxin system antitoxin subunit [Adlercreutzia sp.]|uniref:hypothetical protein n=1 Tax=uncultured Adlercreutzia sp. TaxID=875803 RepID=UPI00217483A8|nr:hypothetical protein [uncultured Adlercreutzia sp.]MCI8424545.1 toxin-antitoxin system antitoxin subunit [Adlercreutzia sp.]
MNREKMNELLGMTEEQVEELAASFEEGRWNREEYGRPRIGRPALFDEPMRPITFKETPAVIAAIDARAAQLGATRSDYLRLLVARDLASA